MTAVLPKPPICAIKLGHRTSSTDVERAPLFGVRRSRRSTVAALLNPFRGLVLASEGVFIYQLNKIKSLKNELFRYFSLHVY